MTFKAVTWNVLASSYLDKGDYSATSAELLDPERRVPAIVRRAAELGGDLLCLQEVEADVLAALREGLTPLGYAGALELKGRTKPDGCATFYRTDRFALLGRQRLEYHDRERGAEGDSGFIALILALDYSGRALGVANTHLRWDKPGTSRNRQIGYRQAEELLQECRRFVPACSGWLVCGDFNRGPESEVPELFRSSGFESTHAGRAHLGSAVINGKKRLIDYLFISRELAARPIDQPRVRRGMALPSKEEPSDHLPLVAELGWKDLTPSESPASTHSAG